MSSQVLFKHRLKVWRGVIRMVDQVCVFCCAALARFLYYVGNLLIFDENDVSQVWTDRA